MMYGIEYTGFRIFDHCQIIFTIPTLVLKLQRAFDNQNLYQFNIDDEWLMKYTTEVDGPRNS